MFNDIGELQYEERGDDNTFIDQVKFNTLTGGGTVILKANLQLDYSLVIKLSMNTAVQPYQYREQDDFRLRHFENGLDHALLHIQRLYEKFTRVIGFTEKISINEDFNSSLDDYEILPNQYIRTNEDGDGIELRDFKADVTTVIQEYIEEGGGGVPQGGEEFALLEKKSNDDGDADWTAPMSYAGFSENYNQIIDLKGQKAINDFVLKMGYAPPTLSLSSSVSTANREKGNAVTSMTLSALVGKVLDDIAEVRFYQNPSTLLDTQTSGPAIPNGGTNTYAWSGSFADNTSFRAEVDDTSVQSKPSRTSTITYNFFYAWLNGKGGAGESAANVYAMNKTIGNPASSQAVSYTLAVGEKPYFAYSATFADLTSIKNINNLETIGSWIKRTENITNAYGQTTSYKIYEFNNLAGEANSNTYTFIR